MKNYVLTVFFLCTALTNVISQTTNSVSSHFTINKLTEDLNSRKHDCPGQFGNNLLLLLNVTTTRPLDELCEIEFYDNTSDFVDQEVEIDFSELEYTLNSEGCFFYEIEVKLDLSKLCDNNGEQISLNIELNSVILINGQAITTIYPDLFSNTCNNTGKEYTVYDQYGYEVEHHEASFASYAIPNQINICCGKGYKNGDSKLDETVKSIIFLDINGRMLFKVDNLAELKFHKSNLNYGVYCLMYEFQNGEKRCNLEIIK